MAEGEYESCPYFFADGADRAGVDDQVSQLRDRIIRTITRRVAIGFGLVLVAAYIRSVSSGVITSPSDLVSFGLLSRNLIVAQLVVSFWLGASLLMNPLGGRYLRVMGSTQANSHISPPAAGSTQRIAELGLPGLRPVASVCEGANDDDQSDVYQTADRRVTVVLDRGALTALSRLTDGRILVTTDLMVVPCEQLVVNLKTKADPLSTMESHLRLAAKLASLELEVVAESPSIVTDLIEIERKALRSIGPVAGGFLALHGSARAHRLLVAPTRHDLLASGLRFGSESQTQRPSSSVTPREQSRVASTVRRSTDTMASPLSS